MTTSLTASTVKVDATSGSIEIGGSVADLVFIALVLTVLAASALSIARPWELRGGRFVDKIRVGEAVSTYDFWLGLRGVPRRRRRELRTELRANLWEAAQRVGAKDAIAAVGPLRRLAFDSVPERQGPRWGTGAAAGVIALELVVAVQLLLAFVVADTVQAAEVPRLDVAVTLVPGMNVQYEELAGNGFGFSVGFGPACLVVGLVVFVLVAQPWRLLHRRAVVPA